MSTDRQRTSRAAFDAARASFERLTSEGDPRALAQALTEAWAGTEQALCALANTDVLSGVAIVRELRQRNLLALDDAHALVDFHAVAERAASDDYAPTQADLDVARRARERLVSIFGADLGGTRDGHAPHVGRFVEPVAPADSDALAPVTPVPPPARGNTLAFLLVGIAVLAVIAAGWYYARVFSSEPSSLRKGRAAYAAGDRQTARDAFATAVSENPKLAEPHIYLGRIARDLGDRGSASAELRRAVELEPDNFLAHRELAALLLTTEQLELARTFYQRAIELNPDDKVSLGYMACTLHRLGRGDLAVRFSQRAGAGPWQGCLALMPGAPGAPPLLPPPPAPR